MLMIMRRKFPLALLFALAAGCGGSGVTYVPVSGVVTLDGKPYKNAIVSFQPQAVKGNLNPGRGSSALTDEAGKYSLATDEGARGAVPGKHLIRIRTKTNDPTNVFDPSVGSADSGPAVGKKKEVEPIPLEWFADSSTKEFEVPPKGTDKANFEIVTKKK
jgi:hypothetical protein